MRGFFAIPCLLLIGSCAYSADPVQALRFEGVWKLNGPDPAHSRLEFQVNGDSISATLYHPNPLSLSDIQIQGDRFTASYLDEFAARRVLTGQLRGSRLELSFGSRDSSGPVMYSGSRIAPSEIQAVHHQVGGTLNTSGKSGSVELNLHGHTIVLSGGVDGNCVSGSVGSDGKGVSMNGCLSVSKAQP